MSANAKVAAKLAPVPATPPEVETWIKGNKMFLDDEAMECLRKMNPVDQRRVISEGGLRECHTPVAVIKSRVRKAKDAEILLSGGKLPQRANAQPEAAANVALLMPEETVFLTSFYMHGQPTEVKSSQSRFAASAGTPAPEAESSKESFDKLGGTVADVGGVIEVGPKAKYGCVKGQRVKVVGQTPVLWMCKDVDDGDKMINKAHKNNGWRWIFAAAPSEKEPEKKTDAEGEKADDSKEQKEKEDAKQKDEHETSTQKDKEDETSEQKDDDEKAEKAEDAKEKKGKAGEKAEKKKGKAGEKTEDGKEEKKDKKAGDVNEKKKGKKGEVDLKKSAKEPQTEDNKTTKKKRKRSPSRSSSSSDRRASKKKPAKSARSKRKKSRSSSRSSNSCSESSSPKGKQARRKR